MTWLRLLMSFCKFSGVSAARIFPSYMITTRWQVTSASGKMCVEIKTVCLPPRLLINARTERI